MWNTVNHSSMAEWRRIRLLARQLGAPRSVIGNYAREQGYVQLMQANAIAPVGFRLLRTQGISPNNMSGNYIFRLTTQQVYDSARWMQARRMLERAIDGMLEYVRLVQNLYGDADRLQIVIVSRSQAFRWVSWLVRQGNINARVIFNLVLLQLQSNTNINASDAEFTVFFSRNMQMGGYCTERINVKDYITKKSSIMKITTRHGRNDCFFQCLYLAKMYPNKDPSPRSRELGADEIMQQCRHPIGKSVDICDINKISKILEVNIIAVDIESLILLTKAKPDRPTVFMLYQTIDKDLGHFHFIKPDKVGNLWNRRHFCLICMKGYDSRFTHPCIPKCLGCKLDDCEGVGHTFTDFSVKCPTCNLYYYDDACVLNHKCVQCRCPDCGIIYDTGKKAPKHYCGKTYCRSCKGHVYIETHKCYISPLHSKKLKKIDRAKIVYYDYETYFKDGEMMVALIVAIYGNSDEVFKFTDEDEFINWIFQRKHRKFTFIAHNGGRFDFHFIKRQMIRRKIKSSDIVIGNTIICSIAKQGSIRFIDSYRFIGIALRNFPDAFGFEDISKGWFPYEFLNEDTLNYVGPMPDENYFAFDSMKPKERLKGKNWHRQNAGKEINLFEMCLEYCIDDVKILKQGCELFQDMFLEISEVNPFAYMTIASTCMALFRRLYLGKKQIGLFRNEERVNEHIVRWQAKFIGDQYNHVSATEIHDSAADILHIFAECMGTGCQICYKRHTLHPTKKIYMYELEHDFNRRCEGLNTPFKIYKECGVEYVEGPMESDFLNIRDAFFGGRVEPMKLYYKCRPNEKIEYYDFTSLYPSVLEGKFKGITAATRDTITYTYFPIGHGIHVIPEENNYDISTFFGFIKCDVECPQDLYIPLLPERRDGKLIFDLLPKIRATYTTVELEKALELGYKITKIYDILHFTQKSDELFRGYIATFIKMKMEAGGWKKLGCFSEEEKNECIKQNSELLNIEIDPAAMNGEYNAGKYFIAKNVLNNLWGKFGQKEVFAKVEDTFTELQFAAIAHNDKYRVRDVIVHDNCARTIGYIVKDEFAELASNTNVAIAAFTTAYGRLRLYMVLELLQHRVLYMDTDGIMFVNDGTSPVVTGYSLGDLTSELGEDESIVEFVSTGPKSYAYMTSSGKTEIKIKGFSLNFNALKKLNFETLKQILFDECDEIKIKPFSFDIDKRHNIKKRVFKDDGKKFRYTYNKRRLIESDDHIMDTEPFVKE